MPPNLYPPPPPSNAFPPPTINPNYRPGGYPPPSSSFPMPYPNRNPMPPPFNRPRYPSQSRRRTPERVHHRHRSRRCRPVIHIIDSDSCSSISTCSSISSCSRRHRRSYSYPRRHGTCQQQQQQQPIILLPIQCQQQPTTIKGSYQGQPQQIILPSTQVQQPRLALPSTSTIQQSFSMPQIVSSRKPQQFQAGPITYVQAKPQSSSSSQLPNIPVQLRSSTAQQRVFVNSTNNVSSSIIKPIPRAASTHNVSQHDLNSGGHAFERYENKGNASANKNDIQSGQRRETRVT